MFRMRVVLALFVWLVATSARSQPVVIPETPAGRALSAWLEAFNSGDRTRLQDFLNRAWPSRILGQELAMREQSGGFDLRALQEATPTSLTGLIEARDGDDFASFQLVIDPDDAQRIKSLNRRLAPRPAGYEVPRLSDADAIEGLRSRLDKDVQADRFAGAVLVVKQGKTLFSGAYGQSDRDRKIPNTLDTRFRIGSMNKMFTATAVLQLVQAGKIKLDEPLGKYVTDYPNRDLASKVTINHLLTHTGGTGDIFGPQFTAHRLDLKTHDDYVALYGTRDLLFEPGSRWEYSNYGMVLLGVVIERVSGQSYYDYVDQHIFKRAGMSRSGSEPESVPVAGRSIGYTRGPGQTERSPNTATLPYRGMAAGGGYSTAGDLAKFGEALLGNRLLDAKHTDQLIAGKVSLPGGGGQYAYGFEDVRKPDGSGFVGHSGGAPGMNGTLRIFPQAGYVVVVLSNLDPPAAMRISGYLELRLGK